MEIKKKKILQKYDNRGIRTLASEEIGTLILRLRPTRPDCLFHIFKFIQYYF